MKTRMVLSLLVALVGSAGFAAAEDAAADPATHVQAVRALVDAYVGEDRDSWDAHFAERVRGRQPAELWQAAGVLIGKFGKIEDVALARWDEKAEGAFVKVTFANATRELFVRLEEGKVRQLDYVPPPAEDAH